jgi:hypothetical protein
MKSILRSYYRKPIAVYLIAALIAISTFAGPAEAMFVPAAPVQGAAAVANEERAADLGRIQAALESRIVRQKLIDYGLSAEDALARVSMLTDKQIHELAAHTDSIQAGGDPADVFFGLVIIALLVVALVFLLQHRIEVR